VRRGWEEELEVRAEEFGELVGARELFGWNIDIGPFVAIVVGVLIIAGAIYKQSQRKT
jgi:hypothetical protein